MKKVQLLAQWTHLSSNSLTKALHPENKRTEKRKLDQSMPLIIYIANKCYYLPNAGTERQNKRWKIPEPLLSAAIFDSWLVN